MSKESLADYYKASDIFVLPTHADIWGLVINEAMSYGLPIVTTNNCGAGRELIVPGINGFLVDTIKDLRTAIEYLVDNIDKRSDITENNLKKISTYTIENMVDIHLKFMNGEYNEKIT